MGGIMEKLPATGEAYPNQVGRDYPLTPIVTGSADSPVVYETFGSSCWLA